MMANVYFVAGTDTEVGKTFSSCALLAAANSKGLSSMALKPIAAGADEYKDANDKVSMRNEDAVALMSHMSVDLPYSQVNPVLLKEAASPHIAAALEANAKCIAYYGYLSWSADEETGFRTYRRSRGVAGTD